MRGVRAAGEVVKWPTLWTFSTGGTWLVMGGYGFPADELTYIVAGKRLLGVIAAGRKS